MKIFRNILSGMLALLVIACNEGIDSISHVAPGEDLAAPTITIANPNKAKIVIPFTEEQTNMDFRFEVEDDIEIKSITVTLNNSDVATYNSFLDYRKSVKSYVHNNLPVGHHSVKITATDMSDKTTAKTFDFEVSNIYEAKYAGEVFYMPFEGGVYLDLLSKTKATAVGTPGFADGKFGKAYAGGAGEYLTFPTAGLASEEFSASLWYNVNASPDRAGVLTIGPPDPDLPVTPNNRKNGFRFFREGSASSQIFKLNVGNGGADSWFDGGATATVSATAGWVHLAFTISNAKCVVYINGEVVKEDPFTGVDWTGCDILSIASGAPRFMEWNHLSDASLYDEIRCFNKALTKEEVKAVMEDK